MTLDADIPLPEEALFPDEHEGDKKRDERSLLPGLSYPSQLYLMPLNRRPFFPGMAAPIVIEPGLYYEVLKIVAKTEHKCLGLFLTEKEDDAAESLALILGSIKINKNNNIEDEAESFQKPRKTLAQMLEEARQRKEAKEKGNQHG